jgi:CYTH domain-containing protein
MIELERTFLAKSFPEGLKNCIFKEMLDIYLPDGMPHASIRIRKRGDKRFVITKKQPVNKNDHSKLKEETIVLTKEEFELLEKGVKGRRVHKLRYYYDYNGKIAEFDVFADKMKGLVLVDFEFETEEDKTNFQMPEFCLADVTQDKFVAGGMLCGKSYEDIQEELDNYDYTKLFLE